MITGELRNQIDKVWNAFWTGGISNPLMVIEQITYLLFIKRLDELQTAEEKKANLLQKPIEKPIFPPDKYDLRWSRFKDKSPEEMLTLFKKEGGVFDFIRGFGKDSSFSKYMKGANFMIPTARLLDQVVQLLSAIEMRDRDTKGDVYEYLLSKIESAGQNGQFRTPRHIIKMIVAMMEPTPEDIICDPSAGSCGFLVMAGEYIREKYAQELLKPAVKEHFENRAIMGMEFDPTMIRIGAMNLLLHGIENAQIQDIDALSKNNEEFKEQSTLALANPPFKGSLDADHVLVDLLRLVQTKKTELLFLALMLRGLKTGGRAAVIVPDGVLFSSSKAHLQIRRELVEKQKLQAIISMPSGVFKPYAGVSTAVLIFTKTNSGGTDKVWFYDMKADGRSLDDKRTVIGPDFEKFAELDALIAQHQQQPITNNDIPDIVGRWRNKVTETSRKRTEQSFFVPLEEIRTNKYDLSINRYKEVSYEQKTFDSPEVILDKIKQLDEERKEGLQLLEEMLGQNVETGF